MPVKKAFRRVAGIVAISLLPTLATAAGLGKINVMSALGQPLLAEIDLIAVTAEEFPSLAARLATQDAYREANVEYPGGIGGFRFTIDKRANGQPFVRVSTGQPVNEPFLDLLVELNWSAGRLLREYPVLLDPPGYAASKPQAPPVTPPQAPAVTTAVKPIPQPSGTEKPATSSAQSARPGGKSSASNANEPADTYGPVKSGETLRAIAESVKPEGMSLDQVLVSIYRENKGAFLSRNMNRLKTGMILKVPAASDIAAVSPEVARREVVAQTADWNVYRKRLANVAERTPGQGEKSGQSAAGKVDTKVSEEGAPPESGKDVLKLSKGEGTGAGKGGKVAGQEKLNAMQEELVARDRALDDARSRITELEKQIAEMRRLLELKGTPLPPVAVAKPTTPTPPVAEKPTAMVKPPVTAMEPKPAEPDVKPMPPKVAEPAANTPPPVTPDVTPSDEKPKKPKRIMPPPPLPEEPSFLDGLLENPLVPAGGAALLGLLGFLGYRQFRKRKDAQLGAFTATAAVPMGPKGGAAAPATLTPDAGNSSFLSDFDKIGAGNIDTDEVDPVAEADVYIAYGRDAQAEEILKEAMSKDGARYEIPLKLLEIYANRKSVQSFETVAKQLHGSIGTQHPLWSKVAEMGRKIDADNPLYAGGSMRALSDDRDAPSVIRAVSSLTSSYGDEPKAEQVPAAMKDTMTLKEPTLANSPLDLDLDFDANASGDSGDNLSPNTGAHSLDFDLGDGPGEIADHTALGEHIDLEATPGDKASDPFVLDFDLDTPEPTKPAPAHANAAPSAQPPKLEASPMGMVDLPPLDLSDIDLDLGGASTAPSGGGGGSWQSAATKLDLARAYLEIGDKVGAVEILQEVIKEGSQEQQEEAKKLAAQA